MAAGSRAAAMNRHALVAALVVALASLMTLGVFAHGAPGFALDLAITRHVQDMRGEWIGDLLRPFNQLGFPPVVGIVDAAIIALALMLRARWEAAALTFAAVGGSALNFAGKLLVERPRPPGLFVHVEHVLPAGTSFPAGHVLNFTAFAGFLCYLAWARMAPSAMRSALVTVLCGMIALMGVARIHAGEHWPSDVLGGYLIGGLWLAATIELYRWRVNRAPDAGMNAARLSGAEKFSYVARRAVNRNRLVMAEKASDGYAKLERSNGTSQDS
jgi:undecaprenyl-diphosphatase